MLPPPKEWYDKDKDECVSEPASADYQRLCRNLLKTQIEAYKIEIERLKGNYGNPYDRALERLIDPHPTPPKPSTDSSSAPTTLISQGVARYMKEKQSGKQLRDTTFKEYEDACNLLIRIVGDKPLNELNREDVLLYLNTIKRLPPHINKKPEMRDKSIKDIISLTEKNKWKTLSESAVGKKFNQLKAFIKWASSGGLRLIPHNVSEGLSVPSRKNGHVRKQKKPYTRKDISGLIEGLIEERKKGTFNTRPERYWIPLIALFSGMRQEEICQLLVNDIKHTDNVWCFDVDWLDDNDEPVKTLKNQNAQRLVPIHPVLIDLGFLDYVNFMKDEKHPRLWMSLKRDSRGKYSRNLKDWYNGADNREGFENLYIDKDPKKSFHSLRHTFINTLKQTKGDMLITSEIVGHGCDNLASERYSDEYSPSIKLDTLQKVSFGFDFVQKLGKWTEWT